MNLIIIIYYLFIIFIKQKNFLCLMKINISIFIIIFYLFEQQIIDLKPFIFFFYVFNIYQYKLYII